MIACKLIAENSEFLLALVRNRYCRTNARQWQFPYKSAHSDNPEWASSHSQDKGGFRLRGLDQSPAMLRFIRNALKAKAPTAATIAKAKMTGLLEAKELAKGST